MIEDCVWMNRSCALQGRASGFHECICPLLCGLRRFWLWITDGDVGACCVVLVRMRARSSDGLWHTLAFSQISRQYTSRLSSRSSAVFALCSLAVTSQLKNNTALSLLYNTNAVHISLIKSNIRFKTSWHDLHAHWFELTLCEWFDLGWSVKLKVFRTWRKTGGGILHSCWMWKSSGVSGLEGRRDVFTAE